MYMEALVVVLATLMPLVSSRCPFSGGLGNSAPLPTGHPQIPRAPMGYADAVRDLDLEAVKADLVTLFTNSQDSWPADYGHYGPFFIRLAWHCSGSYRTSDGRGGCDGGRQRFEPERSWDDNTNLDKARALLWPLKEKYGVGLSWGDLMILAGTTAIESMGGPILGFCAGRIDDPDGSWSLELGPTSEQELREPCPVNGQCKSPLGSTTIGLIYLNPEGPMGNPDPIGSAPQVRDTFGRMNMNDTETVALIGGGHAFGKTHGACPKGPGDKPKDNPMNPWAGNCGTGRGKDAFTSGFEGPWTTHPTSWDNTYFTNLLSYEWGSHKGPGDHYQWKVTNDTSPHAPGSHGGAQDIMMLTSDISLLNDPDFKMIVQQFAEDPDAFDNAFKHAWYKLTTRDMGPYQRCMGDLLPPPQPWQNPLPVPPRRLPNFHKVSKQILALLTSSNGTLADTDYASSFVRLAWQCSSTFRVTDYLGGCDGARIRFAPEKDWPINAGLNAALDLLETVKNQFDNLSWADLIVLAGNVAIEQAGGNSMKLCGGRTDATDGEGSKFLDKNITGDTSETFDDVKSYIEVMGLTLREFIVLIGGGHSLGQMHEDVSGYTGSWTSDSSTLSNEYFTNILSESWEEYTVKSSHKKQYKANGKNLFALSTDVMIKHDPEMAAIAQDYAGDNDLFLLDFEQAWTKMMNIDRFSSSTENVCDNKHHISNATTSI